MTDRKNFLGIPISGDPQYGGEPRTQRPLEEFAPIIRAVLDDPTIHDFGWKQYTPYFNDGEPCVFGANGLWVRTVNDVKPAPTSEVELYDQDYDDEDWKAEETFSLWSHPSIGRMEWDYVGSWPNRHKVRRDYTGPDEARYLRCAALEEAIEDGEFDHVLLTAFGDHADITVTSGGIEVEFYDHD